MFARKGYCRYSGRKCWHFKVKNGEGICKKRPWCEMSNEKKGKLKNIPANKYCNIKAPSWCPKL